MEVPKAQRTNPKHMTVPNDPTDLRREPVPIICIWPRRTLEEVLADLRGDGSTDFNPQQPEFPSPILRRPPSHTPFPLLPQQPEFPSPILCLPPSQTSFPLLPLSQPGPSQPGPSQRGPSNRNFENKISSNSDSDDSYIYIYAPSLEERDTQSEGEEESSEEGDDSGDEDYIPKDEDYYAARKSAYRRSSRKRTVNKKHASKLSGLLPDPSKRGGSTLLTLRRAETCRGENWSVVPTDGEQIVEQIPVSVSGSVGKRQSSTGNAASTLNISRQVLGLNENKWVETQEGWSLHNSGDDTLFDNVEKIEELQKRCERAKETLRYKETYQSWQNSAYSLSGGKGHNIGITEVESGCRDQSEINNEKPNAREPCDSLDLIRKGKRK